MAAASRTAPEKNSLDNNSAELMLALTPGIGPRLRKKLLDHFGSAAAVISAAPSDLRAVPGIERFATVRLGDLDQAGPRPLRTMWRISRDQLDQSYGQMTIGELIDRYGGGLTPPA